MQGIEQARALHQGGRLAEAEAIYRSILGRDARQFDALYLLGFLKYQQGQHAAAQPLIERALAERPQSAEALSVLAGVLLALKRLEPALAAFDRILKFAPNDVGTIYNRAVVLSQLGRFSEAVAAYDCALALRPNDPAALYNRGNTLGQLKRHQEALASYDRLLALVPANPELLNNRGNALSILGRWPEALAAYDQAVAKKPDFALAWSNRGNVLKQLSRQKEALASYERALAADRNDINALYSRGNILVQLKRHAEGLADLDRARALKPEDGEVLSALTAASMDACDWGKAAEVLPRLKAHLKDGTVDPFALMLVDGTPAELLECAASHIALKAAAAPQRLPATPKTDDGRLRIAYVSGDFHQHAVSWLTVELFERHDRNRFEVIGLSFGPDDGSELRARLTKAFDQFHDVTRHGDAEVAALMRSLGVGIAVDLKGHTERKRTGIFAYRGAPVQVNYLGYAGTSGADFIDYVIADEIAVPLEQQPFYTESIVHLPVSFQVNDSRRAVGASVPSRAEAGLPEQSFVFCCFNNSFKIAAPVFEVWIRLLKAVDGSVLWLARSNELAAANLRRHAEARGVDPDRLVFASWVATHDQHLARYRLAGLFLDTLPYSAHTTASDALWMGLPIVTCLGQTFQGRGAASVLHGAGLPELVTGDLASYEKLALDLATDPARLDRIRRGLEESRATCPLFDSARFRRHIEAAYTTMWDIWRRGEQPRSFRVEPAALGVH